MTNIKIKNKKNNGIKSLDKTIAWTERIKDPALYLNEKVKDTVSQNNDITDYGNDKIKYEVNRIKDETIYLSKKSGRYTKNIIFNQIKTNKLSQSRIVAQGKKLVSNGIKKAKKDVRKVGRVILSSVKVIINSLKSLVALLLAGGSLLITIIIVVCLVGLLVSSFYGIFFSSHNTGGIKMKDCIVELNNEMDNRIEQIKNTNLHDEVIINSNKAFWKDILSIYAVRVSNGDNKIDVITIDEDKKKILKEIFWDMNSISYETKLETYEKESIGNLIDKENLFYSNTELIPSNNQNQIKVLHINITSKSVNDMLNKYNFNDKQIKQYNELASNKNLILWSSVIYGVFSSNGKITEWKQMNKDWSDIKVGTTNKTMGEIGCLITSIAILIEKSGVSTKNIYPFNPGTFLIALNNNYGFDQYGNLQYSAIEKVVPDFAFQNTVILNNMSREDKFNEIKKYYERGYYISIEVKGATENNQHWVALDNISNNTIIMLDPSSNYTNMWDKYDWNRTSQFIYFKVNG